MTTDALTFKSDLEDKWDGKPKIDSQIVARFSIGVAEVLHATMLSGLEVGWIRDNDAKDKFIKNSFLSIYRLPRLYWVCHWIARRYVTRALEKRSEISRLFSTDFEIKHIMAQLNGWNHPNHDQLHSTLYGILDDIATDVRLICDTIIYVLDFGLMMFFAAATFQLLPPWLGALGVFSLCFWTGFRFRLLYYQRS